MGIIKVLLIVIFLSVSLLVGILLISLSLDMVSLDLLGHYYQLYELGIAAASGGAALILLVIIGMRTLFKRSRVPDSMICNTENGQVTIALSAIERLIRQRLKRFKEIRKSRISISSGPEGTDIVVRVSLRTEVAVSNVSEQMQQIIKDSLQESLGLKENLDIKIQIDDIKRTTEKNKEAGR